MSEFVKVEIELDWDNYLGKPVNVPWSLLLRHFRKSDEYDRDQFDQNFKHSGQVMINMAMDFGLVRPMRPGNSRKVVSYRLTSFGRVWANGQA